MFERLTFTRRGFVTTGVAVATTLNLQGAVESLHLSREAPVCKLLPEQEVGPYYIADELLRSDIVEGKPGVPLALRVVVLDSRTCAPLPNVAVDIWHCDALGLYSGFTKQNPMGPGGPPPGFDPEHPWNHPGPPEGMMGHPPENHPSDKLTFLRGIQISDENGAVDFRTVFPGFYMGRTNHIHFKVRLAGEKTEKSYRAGHTSHTGQIFFPEELAAKVMDEEPYRGHKIHRTTQAEDGVYGDQDGEVSVARIVALQPNDYAAGFRAELIAAVDPSATPAGAQRRWGRRPPPGPGAPE